MQAWLAGTRRECELRCSVEDRQAQRSGGACPAQGPAGCLSGLEHRALQPCNAAPAWMTSLFRLLVSMPKLCAASRSSTLRPRSASSREMASPITPAPITATSASSSVETAGVDRWRSCCRSRACCCKLPAATVPRRRKCCWAPAVSCCTRHDPCKAATDNPSCQHLRMMYEALCAIAGRQERQGGGPNVDSVRLLIGVVGQL